MNQTISLKWLFNKRFRVFYHILFWMFIFSDELLSILGVTEPLESIPEVLGRVLADMFVVYINIYYLMPEYLFKGRTKLYVFLTVLIIVLNESIFFYYHSHEFFAEETLSYWATIFLGQYIMITSLMVGMAIGLKFFKYFIRDQGKIQDLQNINLKTELAFLKDQINPHFLFNSLNNIYVQAKKTAPVASDSILLLSDLLRYQLYDCAKEKVYLKSEIEYLKNYLKVDRLRQEDTDLQFIVNGNPEGKLVAPLIFIPFLENAVKHGRNSDMESFIHISFDIRENDLLFKIKNSKTEVIKKNYQGGIGLSNVKRRLELLYPKRHNLQIINNKNEYEIILNLMF